MSDQGIDRPREIRGPEDCIPRDNCDGFMDSMRGRNSVEAWFTAQEVGQIIALVQKAEQDSARRFYLGDLNFSHADSVAWRSLSDKLKGPSKERNPVDEMTS